MTHAVQVKAPALDVPSAPRALEILICGNPLRGDDGIGYCIATILDADPPLRGVRITFTPQLLPEHAELIHSATQVIFFDCSAITPAGTISVFAVNPSSASPASFTHQLDPSSLLFLSQQIYGQSPFSATLITVGGESFELGEQVSAPVVAAVPKVLELIHLHSQLFTADQPLVPLPQLSHEGPSRSWLAASTPSREIHLSPVFQS